MKKIIFISEENQIYLIEEFNKFYCLPTFKDIRKKIKVSYKKDLEKFLYYFKVWLNTEENTVNIINIENRGKDYHIDHIIPISYGYKYNINPSFIGSLDNLQLISKKENFSKNLKVTEQTKEILLKFNIDINKLKDVKRSKIFVPIKEKEKEIKSTINDKYRLSSFPVGGCKLGK